MVPAVADSLTLTRALYTFGLDSMLSAQALMGWLEVRMVTVLFDLRSWPYSLMHPDQMPEALERMCQERKIAYHLIGHLIGDRPTTPSLYTDSGQRIDYRRYARMTTAREGMDRIEAAWRIGERVALIDRDAHLLYSHRGRFVGPWLEHLGVEVKHIDVYGNKIVSQAAIRRTLAFYHEPSSLSPKTKRQGRVR